ncbi:MotA/TolQ/ExbB proton channel family protein, partial [Undibacterium sp. Di26W]
MKTRFSAFLAATLLALTAAVAVAPVSAQESASAAASAPAAAPAADAAAAPAPAADAAPAPAAAPAKEMVDNPYGLDALWKTGDFVAKGTLIIMVIMSMGSWYILITKIIDQVKLSGQATEARAKFWKA